MIPIVDRSRARISSFAGRSPPAPISTTLTPSDNSAPASSANDDAGPLAASVIDQQAVEGVHFDTGIAPEYLPRDVHPFGQGEQRRLLDVEQDRDDDAIEQLGAALDDVHVTVGQRIEGARIDSDDLRHV
jgi:hypothetical protein